MRLTRLFVFALLVPGPLCAQAKHTPTLEETVSLKKIDSPKISPDGRFVAYRVRDVNWKDNEFVSQIRIVNVATGDSFPLTQGRKSAGQMEWSPAGRWLAFVTEREASAIEPPSAEKAEKTDKKDEGKQEPPSKPEEKSEGGENTDAAGKTHKQIWLISPEGGEAWQLTKSETDVDDFHWSKDGARIAFTAAAPESKASKSRKEKYSDYDVVEKDYQQSQLWLVDVGGASKDFLPATATRITRDPRLNINAFAWSPDSARIAFSATSNPLRAYSGDEDIYLVEVGSKNDAKKVVALPGPDGSPMFSPDGKRLAFYTALAQPYYYYANGHVAVVDIEAVLRKPATAAQDVSDLTARFDEDVQPLEWSQDGIYFLALQKTDGHIFRVDPASLEIGRISSPDTLLIEEASFTADSRTVAFITEGATHMAELSVSATQPFAPRRLTDVTAQVRDWTLGTVEVVSWKSRDGATIEGILHKPADYDPARRYPLLVMIHGGPTGTSQPILSPDEYAYPVQSFLSKGAVVLEPNYRGSAGYGSAFRALNVRNLGVGDMWDVMSGVDSLIAKGIADPKRLGAMGWSEGGYISAFLTTHTGRFKAISVGAGISDWMTYYVNTDITPFTRQYLHATPWDDPEIYAKTSPITTIKQAKTPTLIQQGSNDKRVPVPDSFELYRGLQDLGVPSRLILYTGFGHGVNKPKSQRALLQSNLDWFAFYIWGEAIPQDSPLHGSSELDRGQE